MESRSTFKRAPGVLLGGRDRPKLMEAVLHHEISEQAILAINARNRLLLLLAKLRNTLHYHELEAHPSRVRSN